MKNWARLGGFLALVLTVQSAVFASPVLGQGTWETTLQARDINSDGVVDAYFDTTLNITWLANAAISNASWSEAKTYAASFKVFDSGGAAVSGWRLPQTTIAGTGGCTSISPAWDDCAMTSEMAHLFYETLGNTGYPLGELNNTGPLFGIRADTTNFSYYWSTTEIDTRDAWAFYMRPGLQVRLDKRLNLSSLLVRDGDIFAAVPSPGSLSLSLVALALVACQVRRRERH